MSVQDNISFGVAPLREAVARRDGGARAVGAGEGGTLVRGQGQAAPGRDGAVGRAAAAPVHRARGRREARGAVARRAGLGPRPDLDAEDRAAARPSCASELHDRHRDPQHATGGARLGLHCVHVPGTDRRIRRHQDDVHQARATSRPRSTSRAGSGEHAPAHQPGLRGRARVRCASGSARWATTSTRSSSRRAAR